MDIVEWLRQPWPWYLSGPLIGLAVPALLLIGNKSFGISSSLRHVCAILPTRNRFFGYDWRDHSWNLAFVLGIVLGGFVGGVLLASPEALHLSQETRASLTELGLTFDGNLVPAELFGAGALTSLGKILLLLLGGVLVGFGARYAGGCTSGHAITGLANLQLPSLVAVIGFFLGGLAATHLLLPLIF